MSRPGVLVTGAAVRLGAAIARAFARAGWQVAIHYRSSADDAEALAGQLSDAFTVRCDLSDTQDMQRMVDTVSRRMTDWRAVVNCAAVFEPDGFDALDRAVFDTAMAINARAPIELAQMFLRKGADGPARTVINITDQKLLNSNPDFFSYTLSKHAFDGSIAMLAKGFPRHRTYGLAPGAILPSHDQDEEEIEISHRLNLLARKTGANEIGQAAVFLAEGEMRSGQTLYVDSGQHLLNQPRDVIYLARDKETEGGSA